jgi:hypothetical protein
MTVPLHARISDYTECPLCLAENVALGGGTGHADHYFNAEGALWAVCAMHRVRWYVTRELFACAALAASEGLQRYREVGVAYRPGRPA